MEALPLDGSDVDAVGDAAKLTLGGDSNRVFEPDQLLVHELDREGLTLSKTDSVAEELTLKVRDMDCKSVPLTMTAIASLTDADLDWEEVNVGDSSDAGDGDVVMLPETDVLDDVLALTAAETVVEADRLAVQDPDGDADELTLAVTDAEIDNEPLKLGVTVVDADDEGVALTLVDAVPDTEGLPLG